MPFTVEDAFDLLSRRASADALRRLTSSRGLRLWQTRPRGKLAAALLPTKDDPFAHPDMHALEPQMKTRVIGADAMRELLGKLQMRSLRGGAKIAMIVDADR
jgi:hypothetical protein